MRVEHSDMSDQLSRGRWALITRSCQGGGSIETGVVPVPRVGTNQMSLNPRLVKESFAVIEPVADKAAAYFYGRLFAQSPLLRAMFPPAMDMQRDRLFSALTRIVW